MKAFAVGCVYAEHFWILIVEQAVGAALFLLTFLFFYHRNTGQEENFKVTKFQKNFNRNGNKIDDNNFEEFNW